MFLLDFFVFSLCNEGQENVTLPTIMLFLIGKKPGKYRKLLRNLSYTWTALKVLVSTETFLFTSVKAN